MKIGPEVSDEEQAAAVLKLITERIDIHVKELKEREDNRKAHKDNIRHDDETESNEDTTREPETNDDLELDENPETQGSFPPPDLDINLRGIYFQDGERYYLDALMKLVMDEIFTMDCIKSGGGCTMVQQMLDVHRVFMILHKYFSSCEFQQILETPDSEKIPGSKEPIV